MAQTPIQFDRFSRCRGAATRVILVVGGIICALVAVAFGITQLGGNGAGDEAAPSRSGPEYHTVSKLSFDIVVTASGELDAKNKVFIRNEVEGKTTITDIVDEGSRAYKGDVLVRLADDEITKQIEDSKELVQKGQADKIAAEQALAIEKSEADSLKRTDEVTLALAELELAKWKEGTVVEKRRSLDLAKVEAEDNKRIAERRAAEAEKLIKAQFISQDEYEQDLLKLKQATSALDTAVEAIGIYEKFTYPQEEKKFTSDVEEARASLDRTIRKNTSMIATATATFESATRSLDLKQDRLKKLQEQLAFTTMRAPSDGIVVYASSVGSGRNRRNEPIGKNREASFNENLIILPDTTQMIAILKVTESRMPDIAVGQEATINIDAMRDRPIKGRVRSKATMAEEGSWYNPDVRQYEVRVELPPNVGSSGTTVSTQAGKPGDTAGAEGPIALNPGMRCSGQIFVDSANNVLAIPVHAVFSEGRERFVYVPAGGGRVKRQTVRIGKANEMYVEIRSGLDEGNRVLLRKPKAGEVDEPPAAKDGEDEKDKTNGAVEPPAPPADPLKNTGGENLERPAGTADKATTPANGETGKTPGSRKRAPDAKRTRPPETTVPPQ